VVWSQISGAKVIVEIGLEDFPLDASLGSHFFHNVTSMNVGYFSIPYNDARAFLNFKQLNNQRTIRQSQFIRHVRFNQALKIQMDGRKQEALISF